MRDGFGISITASIWKGLFFLAVAGMEVGFRMAAWATIQPKVYIRKTIVIKTTLGILKVNFFMGSSPYQVWLAFLIENIRVY